MMTVLLHERDDFPQHARARLTKRLRIRKAKIAMMNRITLPAAVTALLVLSACNNNQKPTEVTSLSPDPLASAIANSPKVELPPAIKAEANMRCNPGNSLVDVTFFDGDKMAQVKPESAAIATKLTAANPGDAFTADGGWSLKGDAKKATLTGPGIGTLTCEA